MITKTKNRKATKKPRPGSGMTMTSPAIYIDLDHFGGTGSIGLVAPPWIYLDLDNEFIRQAVDTAVDSDNQDLVLLAVGAIIFHAISSEYRSEIRKFFPEWHEPTEPLEFIEYVSKFLSVVPPNSTNDDIPF